jgi:hypothetical protein
MLASEDKHLFLDFFRLKDAALFPNRVFFLKRAGFMNSLRTTAPGGVSGRLFHFSD